VLTWVVVAPVSRSVRGIPAEIRLGPAEGLAVDCVASFDNLQPIRRSRITTRVGELTTDVTRAICSALSAMVDC
jgi:mRNA interferase MazF